MQQIDFYELLSDIKLEDVFQAYFACRKNKRRSLSALRFEMNYERHVIALWEEIKTRRYKIRSSNAFIVDKPVLREIFAADFRDRIVHHLVMAQLMTIFEKVFSDYSFSCREGKGTLYGIEHVAQMIKSCSNDYAQDCYVLRLDIQGFFFHIDKTKLYAKLKDLMDTHYRASNKGTVLFLLKEILFDSPQKHCHVQGKMDGWKDLPKSKSLFHAKENCGLPIGNLTSQIFANFYLNDFDHYVEGMDEKLCYGRYVDDMVLIHPSKDFLKDAQDKIQVYLKQNLGLDLHPKKIVLQHYAKGFGFTGAYIKPGRIYPSKRFKSSFFNKINELNRLWQERGGTKDLRLIEKTLCCVNSYLGLLKHYQCWRMRLKAWNMLSPKIREVFYINSELTKISIRQEMKEEIRRRKRRRYLPPIGKQPKRMNKKEEN